MSDRMLVIVTASTNLKRARSCIDTWGDVEQVIVMNGPLVNVEKTIQTGAGVHLLMRMAYLGTVPAFKAGVDYALAHTNADIIACLHDDLEIHDPRWAEKVIRQFREHEACGLLGFGGAIGLGSEDLYKVPYQPMQLARIGFRSNLVDAEVHGVRSLLSERVACLDGFSQIGRREFWYGANPPGTRDTHGDRPWKVLTDLGLVHHLYDSLLGALAFRYGWETWFLPIRCRHYGGATAVGDTGYQDWAKTQHTAGDHGFWEQAHRIGYDNFKDVLPLRI